MGAIGTSGKPLASLTQSLKELEEAVERIEQRLLVVDNELASIDRQSLSKNHLTQTLQQFDQLWDVMYPAERVEMVRGVVSGIEAGVGANEMRVRFNSVL